LSLLEEAARMANGGVEVYSTPNAGTKVKAYFQLGHIDRKPLGDVAETVVALIVTNPDIDLTYRYEHDGNSFTFETREIRQRLRKTRMNSPGVLGFIREYITEHTESFS
jgi:hypothetical protein